MNVFEDFQLELYLLLVTHTFSLNVCLCVPKSFLPGNLWTAYVESNIILAIFPILVQ